MRAMRPTQHFGLSGLIAASMIASLGCPSEPTSNPIDVAEPDAYVDAMWDGDAQEPSGETEVMGDAVADTGTDQGPDLPENNDVGDAVESSDAVEDAGPEDAAEDIETSVGEDVIGDLLADTTDVTDADIADDGGPPPCDSNASCEAQNTSSCVLATCDLPSGNCVFEPLADGTLCEDGNLCSSGETCVDGLCLGGAAVTCNDDNPCTDDLCKPSTGCLFNVNFAGCDDGDPCTLGDTCLGGVCTGEQPACSDDNPCTIDACDASGACTFLPADGEPCDDGSSCTLGDVCSGSACTPGAEPGCTSDNACITSVCAADGVNCENVFISEQPCEDGDACTSGDTCQGGACIPGSPNPCDDGKDCTADTCDSVAGCVHDPVADGSCSDGNACTEGDACQDGECVAGQPLVCDDGNVCTDTACDALSGCLFAQVAADCPDDDVCTVNETCVDGQCQFDALNCDDGDACSTDLCDSVVGCEYIDIGSQCNDGQLCTDDGCDPVEGCQFIANALACDDGDPCTQGDTCAGGSCAGTSLDCDDFNACTQDLCTGEDGCVNAPFVGPCDDGNACTQDEACDLAGSCTGGVAVEVDDQVACTIDACDPVDGVTHTPDDTSCPAGSTCDPSAGCTVGDVRLMVTRVMLNPTAADDGVDGQGQWIAVTNLGTQSVDMRTLQVRDGSGNSVAIAVPKGANSPIDLPQGATLFGIKKPEKPATEVPDGFAFVFGEFGDGFGFSETGDIITLANSDNTISETLDMSVTVSDGPIAPDQFPVQEGLSTDLDALALAAATNSVDNDDVAQWCIGSAISPGANRDCARAVINEFDTSSSNRFIELWGPPGGSYSAGQLRVLDADGLLIAAFDIPAGRMPIGATLLVEDGAGAVTLPVVSDGAIQWLVGGVLEDVVGFGALSAVVDDALGLPLFETAVGPAPAATESVGRASDGQDTDDNSADFSLQTPSPGQLNP